MRETEDDKDNDDTGPPRSASLSRVRFRRLLGLPEFPDTIMGVKAALAGNERAVVPRTLPSAEGSVLLRPHLARSIVVAGKFT